MAVSCPAAPWSVARYGRIRGPSATLRGKAVVRYSRVIMRTGCSQIVPAVFRDLAVAPSPAAPKPEQQPHHRGSPLIQRGWRRDGRPANGPRTVLSYPPSIRAHPRLRRSSVVRWLSGSRRMAGQTRPTTLGCTTSLLVIIFTSYSRIVTTHITTPPYGYPDRPAPRRN